MHTSGSPFYTQDHEAFRDQLRRFVEKDISPFIEEWGTAGRVPRELHEKAANIGLLGLGYPQEQGGNGIDDPFFAIIAAEELARAGSGGAVHCPVDAQYRDPADCACGNRCAESQICGAGIGR